MASQVCSEQKCRICKLNTCYSDGLCHLCKAKEIQKQLMSDNQIVIDNLRSSLAKSRKKASLNGRVHSPGRLLYNCSFCKKNIDDECVSLACDHHYHRQCFTELVISSLEKDRNHVPHCYDCQCMVFV